MQPTIRFVTAADGTSIACAVHGSGPPLVFVRGWISHIEQMWEDAAFCAYWSAIGECFTVVRYDMRGNGLSEREVHDIDNDALMFDLEAVIGTLGLRDIVLYGQCFGGPTAITYAARRPNNVRALILDGTFADGDAITSIERRERIISTLRDLPEAGLLLMSHYTQPNPRGQRFSQVTRKPAAIHPEIAAALYALAFSTDVSPLLADITVPTLVLHRRETLAIPFRLGRALAGGIPGSRFAPIEGKAHNPWDERPDDALAAIGDFLDVPLGPRQRRDAGAALATILFTDMEASTETTTLLGDEPAQALVRTHNAVVREALREHGGSEIKHTGDGVMATFTIPSRAVACAVRIQHALAEHAQDGITPRVRIGINAGEPVAEEGDLYGTSVQLARRICDAGNGGDILVSNVVRELCAGKGFEFREHGAVTLKGFPEPVHLYRVGAGKDDR